MNFYAVIVVACYFLYSALCGGFEAVRKESTADAARQEAAINSIIK